MTATTEKTIMTNFEDVHTCFQSLAEHFGATFIDYTQEISILSIALPDGRRQNVRGFLRERSHHRCLVLMSKVCEMDNANIDYRLLFEEANHLKFAKFVTHHDHLEVKASILLENTPLDFLQEVVMEVAHAADSAEHKFTGGDQN